MKENISYFVRNWVGYLAVGGLFGWVILVIFKQSTQLKSLYYIELLTLGGLRWIVFIIIAHTEFSIDAREFHMAGEGK